MQNTHVVELYSRLVADGKTQLTYYDSGIGTYVAKSNFFVRLKQKIDNTLDMALALFVHSVSSYRHQAHCTATDTTNESRSVHINGYQRIMFKAIGSICLV